MNLKLSMYYELMKSIETDNEDQVLPALEQRVDHQPEPHHQDL